MIKTILVSIETGLRKMAEWQGWEPKDRLMIQDMYRQVKHLQRRHEQREITLQKGGRGWTGRNLCVRMWRVPPGGW